MTYSYLGQALAVETTLRQITAASENDKDALSQLWSLAAAAVVADVVAAHADADVMGTKILTNHCGSIFPNERLNDTRKPISQLAGETLSLKKSKLNSEPTADW